MGNTAGKRNRKAERGTALVLTLLIITTLAGLTIGFSGESGVELTLAGYSRDSYKAYLTAKAGIDAGMALLAYDEDPAMDSLNEDWAQLDEAFFTLQGLETEGIAVSGGIADESGKINLNLLRNNDGEINETREEHIRRLFLALGLKEEMVNPILDWLDGDDVEMQDGAEAYYYENLDDPYPCGNGPFLTPGQIFLVKGMGKIKQFEGKRLLDYITIYSDGKVNINTAPKEVLQCLSESMDAAMADAIIEFRKDEDFMGIDDLKKVPAISGEVFAEIRDWITVKGSTFSIDFSVNANGAAAEIRTYVLREGGKTRPIYWQVL
ncbi:MAG: type II secretion system minor pseudopilin GspK [Deltaproteobacteria bacterium]|nr:type II secretion system minor pseudopilin GspK [Deltaproteobacteria bacterium]